MIFEINQKKNYKMDPIKFTTIFCVSGSDPQKECKITMSTKGLREIAIGIIKTLIGEITGDKEDNHKSRITCKKWARKSEEKRREILDAEEALFLLNVKPYKDQLKFWKNWKEGDDVYPILEDEDVNFSEVSGTLIAVESHTSYQYHYFIQTHEWDREKDYEIDLITH